MAEYKSRFKGTEIDDAIGKVDTLSINIEDISEQVDNLQTDKQDNLVSGTNIKTINNLSILGEGNLDIQGGEGSSAYITNIDKLTSQVVETPLDIKPISDFIDITTTDDSQQMFVENLKLKSVKNGNMGTSETDTNVKRASVNEYIPTLPKNIKFEAKEGYQLGVYRDKKSLVSGAWVNTFTTLSSYTDAAIAVKKTDDSDIEVSGGIKIGLQDTCKISYTDGSIKNAEINTPLELTNKRWINKKAVFLGDSITYGINTTTGNRYWEFLKSLLQLKSSTGYGVAGSCISTKSDYGTGNSPMVTRYTTMTDDADLVCVFGGTNDYGHKTPLGTIADTTDISFYGALEVLITGLINKYPNARICYMTPLHRYGFGGFNYDSEPNAVGANLGDYVKAIKEVCQKHGIPVIDAYSTAGLDPSIEVIKTNYVTDGLHPNEKGHKLLAERVARSFENL